MHDIDEFIEKAWSEYGEFEPFRTMYVLVLCDSNAEAHQINQKYKPLATPPLRVRATYNGEPIRGLSHGGVRPNLVYDLRVTPSNGDWFDEVLLPALANTHIWFDQSGPRLTSKLPRW